MASSVSVKHSLAAENAIKTSVHLCCCEQLSYAGHVPKEQAYRQTSPASNMYALGCLLFFALTGRKPARFANEELRASFERDIGVTLKMSKFLQCLLEPVAENRPSASQVWSKELCLHLHVKWVLLYRAGADCIPSFGALHPATALVRMSPGSRCRKFNFS
jgi:serine/threonine protein kinase